MPNNTEPVCVKNANNSWGSTTLANTALDGTGSNQVVIFTAGAVNAGNDGRVATVRIRSLGTNVATVFRLFENNGSSFATASNNSLIEERTIVVTTISQVAALAANDIYLNRTMRTGHRLFFTIGTAVAAGIMANVEGADL